MPRVRKTPSYEPLARSGRRMRRTRAYAPGACCTMCGIPDLDVLMKVKGSWFEQHHPLGQVHEPGLTVPVCLNCHRKLSLAQSDEAVPLRPQPTRLERLLAVIAALASLLRQLADALFGWTERGQNFVAGLDSDYPAWRTAPWAA